MYWTNSGEIGAGFGSVTQFTDVMVVGHTMTFPEVVALA
jgi:hypothetical protein